MRVVQLSHQLELRAELRLGHLVVVQVTMELLHRDDGAAPSRSHHHAERARTNLAAIHELLVGDLHAMRSAVNTCLSFACAAATWDSSMGRSCPVSLSFTKPPAFGASR